MLVMPNAERPLYFGRASSDGRISDDKAYATDEI
jgi:hypothetical protein